MATSDADTPTKKINKWMKLIAVSIHMAWEEAGHIPKKTAQGKAAGPTRNISLGATRIKSYIQTNGGSSAEASANIRTNDAISKTLWERCSSGAKPSITPSHHCRPSPVFVADDPKLVAKEWIKTYRN